MLTLLRPDLGFLFTFSLWTSFQPYHHTASAQLLGYLSAFVILCRLLEIELSMGVFRSFYVIRSNRDKGFCTLYARIDSGFFGNIPTSWKAWKHGFFAIYPPSELGSWPIKTRWNDTFNNEPLNKLSDLEEKSITLLFECGLLDIR